MTVRAWFTISAVVLAALAIAVALRFFGPVPTPAVIGRAGDMRLSGAHVSSCWPQRGGELGCARSRPDPDEVTVASSGKMRFVVGYPAQPQAWQITVAREDPRSSPRVGPTVLTSSENEFDYELGRGSHRIDVQARYPDEAFVHYRFDVRVR